MRIGFGKTKRSATIAPKPTNHIHGAIAAIARPPSSGTTGSRLKRLRKKPVNASACQNSLPVASQIAAGQRGRAERAEDRAGEADARLGERVVAERLADDRAEERDEEHARWA